MIASGGLLSDAALPKRCSSNILPRLTTAQRAQTGAVETNILPDLGWIGPGVLAQSPSYRLLQKEFPRCERGFDAGVEQLQVGLCFESKLADDRCALLPQISRLAPHKHLAPHDCGIGPEDWPDAVRC